MIIRTLLENNTSRPELGSEHGLSLVIESGNQTILFDTGASDLFSKNAKTMGVDLAKVDFAVISHGHYDHGGGLSTFLQHNDHAPVYIHDKALGDYFTPKETGWEYIGIAPELKQEKRFIRIQGDLMINDQVEILTQIQPIWLNPPDNRVMYQKSTDQYELDDFDHEQDLIIRENGKTLLVMGCAHKGIVNILDAFRAKQGKFPDAVIGGFHLINETWDGAMIKTVDEIGRFLKGTPTMYYTGHCTGKDGYLQLKAMLGDQIEAIASGVELRLFESDHSINENF
ncbi:MAG: MBL fold metallo-hydrolase [Clostridiaceae bacterium]